MSASVGPVVTFAAPVEIKGIYSLFSHMLAELKSYIPSDLLQSRRWSYVPHPAGQR